MYISKLEIFGFKSFAKKTNFQFGAGITGVVGPNGCGKTNVVDAIRWVLGEQKTSVLRSDNMSDVIFNGSKSMKPLGMCEVSLNIHNNRGVLPIEFNDVVVTRRLYQDGQSEYLLNKKVCRLKDIQDLFVDTGMSSDAYSVIELKMVESILSDAKDERTMMFEEAAGVNKYKKERRAARQKLDATKKDLLRLNDILYEVEKNVSSLKRQMRKYERYQRYQSELQLLESDLAGHKLWMIERDLSDLEEQLERGKNVQDTSANQLEIDEALRDTLQQTIRKQEDIVSALDEEIAEVGEVLQDAKRNILVWTEQRHSAERTLKRLAQEKASLADREQQLEKQIKEVEQELETVEPRLDEAQKQLSDQQELYRQVDQRYQKARETLNEYQDDKIENITELANLRNQRERLIDQRKESEEQLAQQRHGLETLSDKLHAEEKKFHVKKMELEDLENSSSGNQEHLEALQAEQRTLQEQIEKVRETLVKYESQEDVLQSKIDFYQELIENREGFSSGVQYLTGEQQVVDGIIGTIADIIQVEEAYQLAVENALGDQAEYLLAESRKAAIEAIQTVARNSRGRISVIPLDAMPLAKGSKLNAQNGYERLVQYIQVDKQYKPIIETLLGDVLVSDSLEALDGGADGDTYWRFVTLDGEVLEHSGILRGGRADSEYTSRVGRQKTIKTLEASLKGNRAAQQKAREQLTEYQKRMQSIQQEIAGYESRVREWRENRRQLEQELTRAEYEANRYKQLRQDTDDRISALQDQKRRALSSLEDVEPALNQLQEQRQQLQHRVGELEDELEIIVERRNTENTKLQDIRLKVAAIENEQKTLNIRLNNSQESLQDIQTRFETIDAERNQARDTIQQRTSALEQEEYTEKELEEQHRQLKTRRQEQHDILRGKQEELREVEERIRKEHQERESQFDRIRNIERQVSELQSERRSIVERMQDRHGISVEATQLDSDSHPEEMAEQIESLKSRINRVGPVNMAVKDEFEEEQHRLEFLTDQRDDLLQSEEDLLETIDRIDIQARKQFKEVFDKIRQNFHRTFGLFFPGGQADLRLESDSDPLEADIEIQASPAGKKLQSLRMLSAGEKTLTAIAILFAIYMVKPSPFCILDEVDAPLDDNNSQVFTRVLNEFAHDTQFIIVTHNKITMEAADYLYGVTMENEGVSKVVSVNFEG